MNSREEGSGAIQYGDSIFLYDSIVGGYAATQGFIDRQLGVEMGNVPLGFASLCVFTLQPPQNYSAAARVKQYSEHHRYGQSNKGGGTCHSRCAWLEGRDACAGSGRVWQGW